MAVLRGGMTGVAALAAAFFLSAQMVSCATVDAISYENIGFSGTYNRITSMNNETCACTSTPYSFSGPMAPLDHGLSIHVRGPIALKQFAVYMPGTGASKTKRDSHVHRHARHARRHQHGQVEKRDVVVVTDIVVETDYVDATMYVTAPEVTEIVTAGAPADTPAGAPASAPTSAPSAPASVNVEAAPAAANKVADMKVEKVPSSSSTVPKPTSTVAKPTSTAPKLATNSATTVSKPATTLSKAVSTSKTSSSAAAKTSAAAAGAFTRTGYYNSKQGVAEGLTMLNNMGGQGSGTFDYCFGNSLSYMNSKATGGSATPQVLADMTIPSNTEFSFWTDQKCDAEHCGFFRPDIPAFRGFEGANKIFLFEFSMPADSAGGANGNMPAIWALNVEIPLATQYGPAQCSCWNTGCGEFDMFEVLTDNKDLLTTHYHSDQGTNNQYGGGGTSDALARPYSSTIKTAVVFNEKDIYVTVLDDSTDFSETLTSSFVTTISKKKATDVKIAS